MAYYFIKMVIISIKFKERSEGADEMFIWIPQASLATGSFIFFICIFHHLVFSILDKKID
jgi:membrane protein CcdC involved in cytochrome C biogenesis